MTTRDIAVDIDDADMAENAAGALRKNSSD